MKVLKVHITDLSFGRGESVKVVENNRVYRVCDWGVLTNLLPTTTTLHPYKETSGHTHSAEENVYFFCNGSGKMELRKGEEEADFEVKEGDIIAIPPGIFHKVCNPNDRDLVFYCVCERSAIPVGVRVIKHGQKS